MIELVCANSVQLLSSISKRVENFSMILIDLPTPIMKYAGEWLPYYVYKLLKAKGTVWLLGTQPQLANNWKYWEKYFNLQFEIIWHKHTPTHENIWCLAKPKGNLIFLSGLKSSVVQYDIVKPSSKEYEGDPKQKRLNLIKKLIKISTKPNDWILDPFCRTGTTLLASDVLERNCLGIEINKKFINTTKRRLKRYKQIARLKKYIR